MNSLIKQLEYSGYFKRVKQRLIAEDKLLWANKIKKCHTNTWRTVDIV